MKKTIYLKNAGILQKISFILFLLMIISACGDGQQRAERIQKEQLKEAKEQTEESINQVKSSIEQRIDDLDKEIEKAEGELEKELKKAQVELKEEISVLNNKLEKVKEASLNEWNDILSKTTEVVSSARESANEISEKVRKQIEKQEEL